MTIEQVHIKRLLVYNYGKIIENVCTRKGT